MGKEGYKSFVKPGSLSQKKTNYERLRQKNIERNKLALETLRIKSIANSLTGSNASARNKSTAERKEKMGTSDDDDDEYILPEGEECLSSSSEEESYRSQLDKNIRIMPSMAQADPTETIPVVATQSTQTPTSSTLQVDEIANPCTGTTIVGSSSSRRARGLMLGKRAVKMITKNAGKKLLVSVREEMRAYCGKNATMAANELGLQIRRMCPIQGFKVSWNHIDPAIKESIMQAVRDKFDITDAYEDSALAQEVSNKKAYILYKDWKCKMRRHYVKLLETGDNPYSHPFRGVTIDDWKYLIDHVFNNPDLQRRRSAGKRNRAKLEYNHTMGSRSFPMEMNIDAENNGGQLPDFCEFYKKSHISKKTNEWIDPICSELHTEMLRVREEAKQTGIPLTHEEISRTVLGEKKRYLKGFGVGPRAASSSFKSNEESRERDEEIQSLRSQVDVLQEELQREREEQQREREEQQREREKESEEERTHREAQQKQMDQLQSTLKMLMDSTGGALNFIMGDHGRNY